MVSTENTVTSSSSVPTCTDMCAILDVDPVSRVVTHLPSGRSTSVGPRDSGAAALSLWLYAVVHAGNPGLLTTPEVQTDQDFIGALVDSSGDSRISVDLDSTGWDELHGVRLTLTEQDRVADNPDQVLIPCTRPFLTPGFVMYVHDPGGYDQMLQGVRVYIGLKEPSVAQSVWSRIVENLDAEGISYRCKILARRSSYPRTDSVVCYLADRDDEAISLIKKIVESLSPEDLVATSPMCTPLAPGLTMARNVIDPRIRQEVSFGQHRCALLAEAIMRCLDDGDDLAQACRDICVEANADPDDLSRNLLIPGQR